MDDYSQGDDFLFGGKLSLKGQRWCLAPRMDRLAGLISQQLGKPLEIGQLMVARGIIAPEDAVKFLDPSLKEFLPDPSILKDMDKAVAVILERLERGGKIAVFGDYDVDGATSGSILLAFFKALGGDAISYVPDRMTEGYGPNPKAMKKLAKQGVDLVITVDCGTLSFDAFEAAYAAGMRVVVVDHHKANTKLPRAEAIINPNRLDEPKSVTDQLGHLAAVGVCFLLVVALNRAADQTGYYQRKKIEAPNLFSYLDRVALGTVCDVVSLTGLNRAFVSKGLKVMKDRYNLGLRALGDIAKLSEAPSAYHLGFVFGPRINAGGRVGRSDLGTRLLSTDDAAEADKIAKELDRYNLDRRALEQDVTESALEAATLLDAQGALPPVLCLKGMGWHPGVIGIVASRLKERYGRPVLICSEDETGEIKGSGRSITGVDLGAAVMAAGDKGLTLKGGGHAMAAGVSLISDQFEEFAAFLNDQLAESIIKARAGRKLTLDLALTLTGATIPLVASLDSLAPYGIGNPAPRILFEDVTVIDVTLVGKNHLRVILKQADGKTLKAMAFRAADEDWGQALKRARGQRYHLAGRLKLDMWTGAPRVDLTLEDAMLVAAPVT